MEKRNTLLNLFERANILNLDIKIRNYINIFLKRFIFNFRLYADCPTAYKTKKKKRKKDENKHKSDEKKKPFRKLWTEKNRTEKKLKRKKPK